MNSVDTGWVSDEDPVEIAEAEAGRAPVPPAARHRRRGRPHRRPDHRRGQHGPARVGPVPQGLPAHRLVTPGHPYPRPRWSSVRRPARSPTRPGSYQFKDRDGRVIYVGKAQSLRSAPVELLPEPGQPAAPHGADGGHGRDRRVDPGPQRRRGAHARVQPHQAAPAAVQHPAGDDKSYPFLAVTLDEEWPRADGDAGRASARASATSGPTATPTPSARRSTCCCARSRSAPAREQQVRPPRSASAGRACCSTSRSARARASARSTKEDVRRARRRSCSTFLDGDTDVVVRAPRERMHDGGRATSSSSRRPACGTGSPASQQGHREAADGGRAQPRTSTCIGIAEDELEAAVQVFFVRQGRVVGPQGLHLDKVEDLTPGELDRHACSRASTTTRRSGIPKPVLVPTEPDDPDALRGVAVVAARLQRSTVRVPQRGDKRELQETVTRNAKEEFVRHRLRRAADHNSRAQALNELQDHLGLPEAPLRIECYDMSHIQGSDYVGSMVVLEDGLPEEVASTAGSRSRAARATTTSPRWRRCSPGGSPPTSTERERRSPSGAASSPTRRSCCWSTAARASWRGRPGARGARASTTRSRWRRWPSSSRRSSCRAQADPIRLPRQSEALYLLQRIRDEAHRFAITYHRAAARQAHDHVSVLDDIPGLGPTRAEAAGQGAGRRHRGRSRRRSRSSRRCRGCPTTWPRPSTTRSTRHRAARQPSPMAPRWRT